MTFLGIPPYYNYNPCFGIGYLQLLILGERITQPNKCQTNLVGQQTGKVEWLVFRGAADPTVPQSVVQEKESDGCFTAN